MGDERDASERHRLAIVEHAIDGVGLPPGMIAAAPERLPPSP
jgi:hypothetical protein